MEPLNMTAAEKQDFLFNRVLPRLIDLRYKWNRSNINQVVLPPELNIPGTYTDFSIEAWIVNAESKDWEGWRWHDILIIANYMWKTLNEQKQR